MLGHSREGCCQERVLLTDSMQLLLSSSPPSAELTHGLFSPPFPSTLYPSNSCPFFRRKKSIEIDLKMSNLINCQLSLQDRFFMDGVNVWFHQASFGSDILWYHQPTHNTFWGPLGGGGWHGVLAKSVGSGAKLPGFKSWPPYLIAVWHWENYLTSLSLRGLIFYLRKIIEYMS